MPKPIKLLRQSDRKQKQQEKQEKRAAKRLDEGQNNALSPASTPVHFTAQTRPKPTAP